jgi:hypothetical protein
MENDYRQQQLPEYLKGRKNKGQDGDPKLNADNKDADFDPNPYYYDYNRDGNADFYQPPQPTRRFNPNNSVDANSFNPNNSVDATPAFWGQKNDFKNSQSKSSPLEESEQAQTQQQEEIDEDEEPKIEINEEQEIDGYHKNTIQEFGSQQRDLLFKEVYLKKYDISYDDINTYINDDLNFFKKTFFEVEEKMTYRNYFDSIRSKLDNIITKDKNCENIKEGEYGQYESNVKNRKICNVVNESIKKLKTNFNFDNFKKFITKNKNNPTNNSQTNNGQKINQTNQNDNSFILDFINTNNGIELSTIEINGTTFVVNELFGPDVNLHNLALSIKKITLFNGKLTKFKNNKTNGGKTIKKHKRNRNKKITNKYNERRRRFTDEFLKIST